MTLVLIKWFKKIIVLGLLCASNVVFSEDQWAGKVDFIEPAERYLSVGDRGFRLTPFTVVREFGAPENQRLPQTRIIPGKWVRVFYEYDEGLNALKVASVELLTGEAQADRLMQEQFGED